ncbi:hypothetical protein C485_18097 [Natrinema altunense JCM 12890]|uniref:Uncharacterized protein n=1 Tax=Natrinema altunense (strain JCM 12890 / CGMCC 1.3731 / AJ2) TaxID=1227494 RepID=L9ZB34_NATA2|nr:hypothetical protein C485_18097 [Natrinema altunense JCM 12890]
MSLSNVSQIVGNQTGSLNYSEAIRVLSSPESAEQALMLFQLESSLAVVLTLLAFLPTAALLVTGAFLDVLDDSWFWLLLLAEVSVSMIVLGLVPFLLSL